MALLPGGLWYPEADRDSDRLGPYAVLVDVAASFGVSASSAYARTRHFQVSAFAELPETLRAIERQLRRVLNPRVQGVVLAEGRFVTCYPTGSMVVSPEQQGLPGTPLRMLVFEFAAVAAGRFP